VGQEALILKDYSLQDLIAEALGGFQGLVEVGISLLVTALLHEDVGLVHEADGSVMVVSQRTVDANALL
jgi:hypothetical protein